MQYDTVADALSALKNARRIGKQYAHIRPVSNVITGMLRTMQQHGYIGTFELIEDKRGGELIVELKKELNDCNVIKPRHYVKTDEYTNYEKRYLPARAMGLLIVSTSQGIMSQREAVEKGIGGSLIAYVY